MRSYIKIIKQLTKNNVAVILLSLLCSTSYQVQAGNEADWAIDQKVKIIKYLLEAVVWPKDAIKDDALHVCILGKALHNKSMNALNQTTINKHKITVKNTTLAKAQECELIYIPLSEKDAASEIIKQYAGKPVLLISDIGNFADQGGSMNFIETQGLIALTVNVEAIKKSHLTFDMNAFNHITVIPKQTDLSE